MDLSSLSGVAPLSSSHDVRSLLLPQPSRRNDRGTQPNNDVNDDDDDDDVSNNDEKEEEQQQQQSERDQLLYRYLRFDEIESTFFPNNRYFQVGTLCWALMSKGKHKSPQLYLRARVLSDHNPEQDENEVVMDGNYHCTSKQQQDNQQEEPKNLVDMSSRRILVQYPAGSTYRVRKSNLLPILELERNVVLVTSETTDYRRLAIVHTLDVDHFVEIGCDFGVLVDSVDAASTLGVDKSEESILGAQQRYPNRTFIVGDVFDESDLDRITTTIMTGISTTTTASKHPPLVVAIDINGTRELPAVLKCIQLAMDTWSPRLVIVKSRELYAAMLSSNHGGHNDVNFKE
jgi:hypothetical protein